MRPRDPNAVRRGVTAPTLNVISKNPAHTAALGAALADWLRDGDVVLLHGDLGAGKTTLVKGIAAALRVIDVVSSPSFALVNEYDGGLLAPVTKLYHLDLYRLQGGDELASIGYEDYISRMDGVTVIEWPERASGSLPERYLLVEITAIGEDRRQLRMAPSPNDETWSSRFADLRRRFDAVNAANGGHQGQ